LSPTEKLRDSFLFQVTITTGVILYFEDFAGAALQRKVVRNKEIES
jgi:hypothetical protein